MTLARLPGDGGGRSLLFNGHIDVVSVGPRHLWTKDPFGGQVVDGRLYGQGASDMKGGLASALFALKALREVGSGLPATFGSRLSPTKKPTEWAPSQ
jgi:acetylornithine deacetylase